MKARRELSKGAADTRLHAATTSKLSDLGIDKFESHRWQRIGAMTVLAGQLLLAMKARRELKTPQTAKSSCIVQLDQLGIDKYESHRWQALARVPNKKIHSACLPCRNPRQINVRHQATVRRA
jgi:hypothetical protein